MSRINEAFERLEAGKARSASCSMWIFEPPHKTSSR